MPKVTPNAKSKSKTARASAAGAKQARAEVPSLDARVQQTLVALKREAKPAIRDSMGPKYGIHTDKAFGVSMASMKALAKRIGKDHALAAALWDTGWYEARMLACMVDEPALVTPLQMDRWCKDFDNWAICDTVCFNLFDRTPHAWSKVHAWSKKRDEFQKRTAFALLWSLSVHDKHATDDAFREGLALIERASDDERHFVKKAVNMALRAVGKRNPQLRASAVEVANRLAESTTPSARWIGKDALRELSAKPSLKRTQ